MKLHEYLEQKKLSTRQFANLIQCDHTQVWRWVKGVRLPGLADAAKIQAGTNGKVKPKDFLDDKP